MSRTQLLAALLALLALCFAGCATAPPTVATIQLTGTPGATITGYYVQGGQRVPLSGSLPQTIERPNLSMLAVRKVSKDDALTVAVRRHSAKADAGATGESMQTGVPAGNADGVRIEFSGGMSASVIRPDESLDAPQDAKLVIYPYWHEGTWVFDDARLGLKAEAFVEGTPEMIDTLVKDIPAAHDGFRLTFSTKPFAGYQKKITWVKAQDGGNVYRSDNPPQQGWLCPELFRYFTKTPPALYIRADAK